MQQGPGAAIEMYPQKESLHSLWPKRSLGLDMQFIILIFDTCRCLDMALSGPKDYMWPGPPVVQAPGDSNGLVNPLGVSQVL